jgi:uncharacterized RDD family membrane protein YckC
MEPQQMENNNNPSNYQVTSPKGKEDVITSNSSYARNLYRYAAYSIDTYIVLFISGIFTLPFLSNDPQTKFSSILILCSVIYSIAFTKLKKATPGKSFFGLEVSMEDRGELTWVRVFLREAIGKLLSNIIGLGYIWILFNAKRQGWHDLLAKTVVIQVREISKTKKILAWIFLLGLPVLAALGILAVVVLTAINPIQQLARTRDAGRMQSVGQLGKSVSEYNLLKKTYPTQTNTWMNELQTQGVLSEVPEEIEDSLNKNISCGSSASNQNGFCYKANATEFIVYDVLEAQVNNEKCTETTDKAWYVYSSVQGRSGVVCLSDTVPQFGQQRFVDDQTETIVDADDLISITPTSEPVISIATITSTPKPTASTSVPKGVRSYGKKTIDNDQKITLLSASINSGTVNASFSLENTKDIKVITSTRFTIRNKDYFISSNNNTMIEMPPNETKTINITFDVSSEELKNPPYTFLYENNNGPGHVLVNAIELGTFTP